MSEQYKDLRRRAEEVGPIFRLAHPAITTLFGVMLTAISTLILMGITTMQNQVGALQTDMKAIRSEVYVLDKRVSMHDMVLRRDSNKGYMND